MFRRANRRAVFACERRYTIKRSTRTILHAYTSHSMAEKKNDTQGLSIKELKNLLRNNGVDYSLCLERSELVSKINESNAVTRLKQPQNPYTEWQKHPNYETGAKIFIGFHNWFREAARNIVATVPKLATSPADTSANIARQFSQLNGSLHHHHSIEDHHFFPKLEQKYGVSLKGLSDDHTRMTNLEREIKTLLAEGQKGEADITLGPKLIEFCDFMTDHLRREELIVVPHILKFKSEAEFFS